MTARAIECAAFLSILLRNRENLELTFLILLSEIDNNQELEDNLHEVGMDEDFSTIYTLKHPH